jgi:hypothetical protein
LQRALPAIFGLADGKIAGKTSSNRGSNIIELQLALNERRVPASVPQFVNSSRAEPAAAFARHVQLGWCGLPLVR